MCLANKCKRWSLTAKRTQDSSETKKKMGHYNMDSYVFPEAEVGVLCVSDEVDFVRKQSCLVSGVSAGFMSRRTSCLLVSDYLFFFFIYFY